MLVWWYQEGYIKWKQKRDRMKVEVIHLAIKLLLSSHRKLGCYADCYVLRTCMSASKFLGLIV